MVTIAWIGGVALLVLVVIVWAALFNAAAGSDGHLDVLGTDDPDDPNPEPVQPGQVWADEKLVERLRRGHDITDEDAVAQAVGVWRDRVREGTEDPDPELLRRIRRDPADPALAQWRREWGWS